MSVIDAVGNTPLIPLRKMAEKKGTEILAKLEGCNPGGSVKDRPALYILRKAEESGELEPGKIVLEATSGNMGISLAMICSAKGYQAKLFMPECVSLERRRIIEAFGAEVVLTPGCEGTDGAINRARELVKEEPDTYYHPDQFSNPWNVLAHYETTGPEIFAQTGGDIDAFVCGIGTTGTIMGTGKYLKENMESVMVVGVEPPEGHTIQGLKNLKEAAIPGIYDSSLLDEKITIGDDAAFNTSRLLAIREGVFTGISSGAAVAGALSVAEEIGGGRIVTILPDRGDRYLSTNLFRSVCAKCPP